MLSVQVVRVGQVFIFSYWEVEKRRESFIIKKPTWTTWTTRTEDGFCSLQVLAREIGHSNSQEEISKKNIAQTDRWGVFTARRLRRLANRNPNH